MNIINKSLKPITIEAGSSLNLLRRNSSRSGRLFAATTGTARLTCGASLVFLTRFRVRARRPRRRSFFTGAHVLAIVNYPDDKRRCFLRVPAVEERRRVVFVVVVVAVVLHLLFLHLSPPSLLYLFLITSSRRFLKISRGLEGLIGCCTEPGRSPGRASPAGKRAIYPRQPHSPTRTPRPVRNLRSLPT